MPCTWGEDMTELRPYKVYAIKEGVVVDHIPQRDALKIMNILGLDNGSSNNNSIVTLGINLESGKHGRKDVVKIENKELTREELNKISLIADDATVSIIKDHEVAEKVKITVPNIVDSIIKCGNSNCITNHQPIKTRFKKVKESPLRMKCHHCEKVFEREELLL